MNNIQNNSYKFRSGIIFLWFCAFYAVIIIKLYYVQIQQSSFYTEKASQQYTVIKEDYPPRGSILDRHNALLAGNKDALSAFIIPHKVSDEKKLESTLKKYFPQALKRLHKNHDAHFMYIKRKLTLPEIALLEKLNNPDIHLLKEPQRFYPVEGLGYIVGITDIDNKGLFGIEHLYNEELAGKPSTLHLEKDARLGSYYFKKEVTSAGVPGKSITLTLDADLQFLTYEHVKETVETMEAQEGAALIINPCNGEILAMVQYPDFNTDALSTLDLELTKNKCVTQTYEFGSVIKPFVALAALEEEIVSPDELIDCQDSKICIVDGFKISTWHAHGIIPFHEVIEQSNNIGIAKVAQRLDKHLYDHYKRLGFGKKTLLSWPGEQKGFITDPKTWSRRSIISLSFGYEIRATLLQLAQAFSVFSTGYLPPLHIVKDQKIELPNKPLYSQNALNIMRTILQNTVEQGTARKAALKGFTVMGKTGTANLLIDGVYNKEHNIFSFEGIIEKDSYKRVIVTFVKDVKQKNMYASSVAAPLFERIAQSMLIHDQVM